MPPTLRIGDIWSIWGRTDLLCVTTNSEIRSDGKLVMGAGIAKQAAQRFPCLPKIAGQRIQSGVDYNLLVIRIENTSNGLIGLFQTKRSWRDPSPFGLIERSVLALEKWITDHKPNRVDMNFPGIGCGGRDLDMIAPILEPLPDCVRVWVSEGWP